MTSRPLPLVTSETRHFWQGGATGALVVLRCDRCGFWIHPPSPVCPTCHSSAVTPTPTTGRGFVYSFTVNHQPWIPGWETPYVIAIVELDDQPGMRLTTSIDSTIDDVHIGMRVSVRFEHVADVYLPIFVPVASR
jgi:hypothetical protein